MDASEAENAECQSAQPWIVQEGADHAIVDYTILGANSVGSIEYSIILDNASKTVYLAIDHVQTKGPKIHGIFRALGFSQDNLMISFHTIARKIENFTSSPDNLHETIEATR